MNQWPPVLNQSNGQNVVRARSYSTWMESFEDAHLFIAEPLAKVFAGLESFLTLQFDLDLRTRECHIPIQQGRGNICDTDTAGFNNLVR